MNNIITIVIIGLYTVIYLIVFLIQKTQITKLTEVNNAIKSYFEIFKIDDIKKYVELKTEINTLKLDKILNDNIEIRKIMDQAIEEKSNEFAQIYNDQMGAEHLELVKFALKIISITPKEEREEFIKTVLPLTSRYLLEMLPELEKII